MVLLKIIIAVNSTLHRLLSVSRRYEGSHCFELQGEQFKGAELVTLEKKARTIQEEVILQEGEDQ